MQVFNPYLPLDDYIPDGEPHVFGDRVYIYGSHDKENGEFFCMLDYVTYSAPIDNLKDWRYEGVIYKASQDPLYPKYRFMFAPDVVKGNDGRYYLYYSLANSYPDCSYVMSVAVCDTPNGKFEFLGHVKHPDGRLLTDYVIFDPGLLNDDGVIRLYYGMWHNFEENDALTYEENIENQIRTFKKSREEIENTPGGVMGPIMVELCDDMVTLKTEPKRIFPSKYKGTSFEGHQFFEASSMKKIGDTYYFVYSPFNNHNLAYATSKYPDRDFTFGGNIISNGDVGFNGRLDKDRLNRTGNNHGGIIEINGRWYVFYHRHTTKTELSRQACAEEIKILPDGSIPQVEMTSCGLNGGPLKAEGTYPSIICCNLTNGNMPHFACPEKTLPHIICKNGERFIAEIGDKTKIGYKYFDFTGKTEVFIKYRSGNLAPQGRIFVKNSLDGGILGELGIVNSKHWTKGSLEIELKGKYPLYFEYEGTGEIELIEFGFEK